MKRNALIGLIVVAVLLIFLGTSHALITRAEIHLSIRVVSSLSLDLNDGFLEKGLLGAGAETFSELRDQGIMIDKSRRGDSSIWIFTKTE
ncbi:MAG: hypothetical protein ISS26_05590 [Candidatus Omnitrophica bacterium]|nr:hypothetical protein [Candidatus Omnitrophota bacterium]